MTARPAQNQHVVTPAACVLTEISTKYSLQVHELPCMVWGESTGLCCGEKNKCAFLMCTPCFYTVVQKVSFIMFYSGKINHLF